MSQASAHSIYQHLLRQPDWNSVCTINNKHVDASSNSLAALDPLQKKALQEAIHAQANKGFQYSYASIPIYDIVHQQLMPGDFFHSVFKFLNSAQFIGYIRELTDDHKIQFADAQATRYSAGDFLTMHNDDAPGKERRVAYVLNLTPEWQADWGGALQFFDSEGHIEAAFLPRFNALNLFAVPADHSVSLVAPFADKPRYSITGWLRSGKDPGS
ncbi:MAG: 2OG-Fe(II) oxygenase family protein [Pseudomonadota bacterium]